MSETTNSPAQKGSVERIEIPLNPPAEIATDLTTVPPDNIHQDQERANPEAPEHETTKEKVDKQEFSEDQLKSYFEKQGIEYNGMDELKKKLNTKAEPLQETDEQKAAKEKSYEKRMVDLFTEGKGTVEQYAAIKSLANSDLKELSNNELRRELKEAKFTDNEINDILKESFFQYDDSELEQYEDETEREYLTRKREYGSKLLENRSLSIKQSAEKILSDLKSAVDSEDLQKQEEEQFSSKVDDYFSKAPRNITFELGTANNRKIDPIDYEVAEKDLAEIKETLKDPAQRNNILFTEEGQLNLDSLATVLLHNKILKSALKAAYLTGETKMTELVEQTYGARTPYEVGVGGVPSKAGQAGSVTQRGAPQRVMPSQTR